MKFEWFPIMLFGFMCLGVGYIYSLLLSAHQQGLGDAVWVFFAVVSLVYFLSPSLDDKPFDGV